jgi:hypothetical protein
MNTLSTYAPSIRLRAAMEQAIVKRVVCDALALGYALSVDDGEEEHPRTQDVKAILDALMNTDMDTLFVHRSMDLADKRSQLGWIQFVYGNSGYDVISDYTSNDAIEALLQGANALADKLEADELGIIFGSEYSFDVLRDGHPVAGFMAVVPARHFASEQSCANHGQFEVVNTETSSVVVTYVDGKLTYDGVGVYAGSPSLSNSDADFRDRD